MTLAWSGDALNVVVRIAPPFRATLVLAQPGRTRTWSLRYDAHAGERQQVRLPQRLESGSYQATLTIGERDGHHLSARSPIVRLVRPGPARVTRSVPSAGDIVALTFDDGTDEVATAEIVQELEAAGEQATFFVNAINYRERPGLVDAVRAGLARGLLTLGDHTYDHPRLTSLSAAAMRQEIARDEAYVTATFGRTNLPYLRPPYGATDARVASVAGALGFTHLILWSVDPEDYLGPSRAQILSRIASEISPGAIVLMHLDRATADALPSVIALLHRRGYAIVSLADLLDRGQA
jgi:peptidoglycan/xylan/chitin deacetylase (PgdA/CDA1 family)